MEKKFIQRESSKYANNEFDNMPSIDYGTLLSERLCKKNKHRIDLDKVKEICDKYGFGYTFINSTFGGDDADFLVYYKTDINADYFKGLWKTDNDAYWALREKYEETSLRLHQCIHELDEQTNLMFECGWSGNCGLFGSHDVKRQTYSGGSGLVGWESIMDYWDSCIHDTLYHLKKGVYVIMYTRYLKPEIQDSPSLEEFEQIVLGLVKNMLKDEFVANFETGKVGYESEPYRTLVIREKRNNCYYSQIQITRDWMGKFRFRRHAPLCGECKWVINWRDPEDDILEALDDCAR